jgi:hypothetical protein
VNPGRRTRLTPRSAEQFVSGSLFDRIARVICAADCLPRKELFESWEVARRARRRFRGGRVVDLACGHGLVAWMLLLLDDSSPSALAVDTRIPASAAPLGEALVRAWPRLEGRVELRATSLETVELAPTDLVVSAHACGALTDRVIARASTAGARLAVLPCCQDEETCDTGGLGGWMDVALAVDATRVRNLAALGYTVITQVIPAAVTPKNRLLLAAPSASS